MAYKYNMCLGLGLYIFVRGFGAACKRRGLISERAHEKRFEARDSSADQIAFRNPFYTFGEELISGGAYNGIYFLIDSWMGLPTSFLGLEREPGNKVVGLQLGAGGRYVISRIRFMLEQPWWVVKLLVFSSFRSTPAPVSGQSSLEIVGWPKSLSFFFPKDCLML